MFRAIATDQRTRFIAVGVINTAVGYAVFVACEILLFDELALGHFFSLVVSYAVGIAVAFILYRRFVFVVAGRVWVDLIRFVTVYAGNLVVNAALLVLLVDVLGLMSLMAQGIALVVTTIFSYVGHRYFSFRRTGESDPRLVTDDAGRAPGTVTAFRPLASSVDSTGERA